MPTLDLHPILRNDRDMDLALRQVIFQAKRAGEPVVQIIHGKATGQLNGRVLAFLSQRRVRSLYYRVEKSPAGAPARRTLPPPQPAPRRSGRPRGSSPLTPVITNNMTGTRNETGSQWKRSRRRSM